MITLIAKITSKLDKIAETKARLQTLVQPSRLEQGCHAYVLHQDPLNNQVFFFYEKWESKEHLAAHNLTPHFLSHKATIGEFLAGPSEVSLLEEM